MIELLELYWPFVLAALLLLASATAFARPSRHQVTLAPPSLADPVAGPTLARQAPPVDDAPPPPVDPASELTQLKGVGLKLAGLLAAQGVTRIDQVAAWNAEQIAALDPQLGSFAGRIGRDRLVEQAQLLQRGDVAAYEAAFGKRTAV